MLPYVFSLLAIFIAYLGLLNARDIARKKAATDLMHSILQDTRFEQATHTLTFVEKSDAVRVVDFAELENKEIDSWLGGKDSPFEQGKKHADVRADIQLVLGYYEFIASGIKRRVYDEEVLHDSLYGRVKRSWARTEGFVDKRIDLTGVDTIYQEFRILAQRWAEKGPPKRPEVDHFNKPSSVEHFVTWITGISSGALLSRNLPPEPPPEVDQPVENPEEHTD